VKPPPILVTVMVMVQAGDRVRAKVTIRVSARGYSKRQIKAD